MSSIEDSRKYRAVIYSGVLFQQNGDRLTGTFKFSTQIFAREVIPRH